MKRKIPFAGCAVLALPVLAAIQPTTLINDNMVLQRDRDVPVWGKATAGNGIKVSYAERFELAGADGKYVPVACHYTANFPTIDLDIPTNMVPKKVAYLRKSCVHSFIKNEAGIPLGPFRGDVTE